MPEDLPDDPACGPRCLRNAFWLGVAFWAVLISLLLLTGCGDHRQAATGARNIVETCDAQEQGAPAAETRAAIKATALALARQLDPRGEVAASVPAAQWLEDVPAAIEATQAQIERIDEETARHEWWRTITRGAWDLVKGWWPPLGAAATTMLVAWQRLRKYRGAIQQAVAFGSQLAAKAKQTGLAQQLGLKDLKQSSQAAQVAAGVWQLISRELPEDDPPKAPPA